MRLGTALVTSILVAGPVAANSAPSGKIAHEPLACIPASGNAKITATWAGAGQVTTARVYFRAAGAREESFLELRRTNVPNGFWAVLPVPSPGVTSVSYRIVLKDSDGKAASSDPRDVPVTASCPAGLSADEVAYAKNLVVGQTGVAQSAVPAGFSCAGVVAFIASNGDMRSLPPCTEAFAATAARSAAPGEKPASRAVTPMRLDQPPLVLGGTSGVSVGGGVVPTPPVPSPGRPQ